MNVLSELKEYEATIWQTPQKGMIFIGSRPLVGLAPLQRNILQYFIANPYYNLTKTQIIESAWRDVCVREGVSDAALQKQISTLRFRLRVFSEFEYVRTWRGVPEGGYRFHPGKSVPAEVITNMSGTTFQEELAFLISTLAIHQTALDELNERLRKLNGSVPFDF